MVFGVQPSGFINKRLDDILSDLQDELRSVFGNGINTSSASVIGQLNGIYGNALTELWEVATLIYNAQSLDTASGIHLDNLGTVAGVTRSIGVRSSATLTINLEPGAVVTAGTIVAVSNSGERFIIQQEANNLLGTTNRNFDVLATAENYGAINAGSGEINLVINDTAGWTKKAAVDSGNDEPFTVALTDTVTLTVDGEVKDSFNFPVAGARTAAQIVSDIGALVTARGATVTAQGTRVRFESNLAGPGSSILVTTTANTEFNFPTDTTYFLNSEPASPGSAQETDEQFRNRIKTTLGGIGGGTINSFTSRISQIERVNEVIVYENVTSVTDTQSGRPPHSVEVVVSDTGTPAQITENNNRIAQAIFDLKSAGINTYSANLPPIEVNITDLSGTVQTIKFSRANELNVTALFSVRGLKSQLLTEENTIALVKQAVIDQASTLIIGQTAIYNLYKCIPFRIEGIVDVLDLEWSYGVLPLNRDNLTLENNQRSKFVFDESDITVTVSLV